MLTNFSITNYYCFKDEVYLDLAGSSEFDFNKFAIRDNIIQKGFLYGNNEKDILAKAIVHIANIGGEEEEDVKPYNPNKLSKFKYKFKFDSDIVEYQYSIDTNRNITQESLIINNNVIFHDYIGGFFTSYISESFPKYKIDDKYYDILLTTYNFIKRMSFAQIKRANEYIIDNQLSTQYLQFLYKITGIRGNLDFSDKYIQKLKEIFCKVHYCEKNTKSFVIIDDFLNIYNCDYMKKLCYYVFKKLQNIQTLIIVDNSFYCTNDLLRPDCNFLVTKDSATSFKNATNKELRYAHNIEKLLRGGTFNKK